MRLLLLLSVCVVTACGSDQPVQVSDAWIREAPPGAMVHAGYLEVRNLSEQDLALTGVSSPAFARVELHEMKMQDGRMLMRRLERLVVPAGDKLRLAPGGNHLMLFESKEPVTAGRKLPLELHFGARSMTVQAEVRQSR